MWTVQEIKDWNNQAEIKGKWVWARPRDWMCDTLSKRIREAWAVLFGKAETFKWPEGQ